MKRRLGILAPPLAVFAAFICAWYFYSGVILDETRRKITLPYFHQVIDQSFPRCRESRRPARRPVDERMDCRDRPRDLDPAWTDVRRIDEPGEVD